MAQYAFGSGTLWGINSAANSTPVRFGALQNVSLDFSANSKTLFGQYQFPLSVARGAISVKGKASFAQLSGRAINELFFGATSAAGEIRAIEDEAGTVGSTPFQITVANSATWVTDLGVVKTSTGIPLTRVASAPATGQYSVAAGVYTFAAADTGIAMKVSYTYTVPTVGQTISIANQAMGLANTFKSVVSLPYNGQKALFTLNACVSSKLTLQTQLEDFTKPSFDFDAFVDSSNNLGTISLAEAG